MLGSKSTGHQPLPKLATFELAGALGAWKLGLGPHDGRTNLLVIEQADVGLSHHVVGHRRIVEQEHRLHPLGVRFAKRRANYGRVAHAGNLVQDTLDVFRKDVQALGRDDHFLLAAADVELPGFIESADVPRVEPAVLERVARGIRRVEVPACHVFATDQDLSVIRDANLDAGDRLADRPARGSKRVIERHDRRGFRQTIALDDEEAEAPEESLELRIERRGPDDDRPEFDPNRLCTRRYRHQRHGPVHAWRWRLVAFGHDPPNVLAQHLEHLRHADQDRNPPGPDLRDDVLRSKAAGEDDRSGQHRRHERRHGLSEHVAERQKIQEADG